MRARLRRGRYAGVVDGAHARRDDGRDAAKLRVYAHETRPGASAVGDALLASIMSDAARLSGEAEPEADPAAGQLLLDRLQFPIWRLETTTPVPCDA